MLFNHVSFPDFTLPLSDPVLVFALLLLIILLAPIVLGRFRIPGIVGLILAGVLIGPHGFNFIKNTELDLLSKVGLLYIMFIAGLDLDMNEFRKYKYRSLGFGILTFLLPMLIGLPVCYYLLDFGFTSSLLISSMFSTHTLVAYPIVSRLGIAKSEAVSIVVGGTIITDTAVLVLLTLITGYFGGRLDTSFWIQFTLSFVLFCIIVFWVFPKAAKWFFKNLEAEKTSQYIFVLAIVFLSAFLAKLSGLEPIIGAFMAGLALNRLIPHTSALMNRIDFIGNAIFIPFFLISVGMLVDLGVLFKGPEALVVAGVLTVVALIGKWMAAFFTQKIFNYTSTHRDIMFGLSSSHAAATIAVILIGYRIGLVNEHVLNGTVILILVTCLVASFVTERAARKLVITEADKVPQIKHSSEKILVPIANPTTIEILIDLALMVKTPSSNEPVTALAVVEDDKEAHEKVAVSNKMLEKAIVHGSATDTKVQIITRIDLNIASGITRTIKEAGITNVILGWGENSKPVGKIFGTTLDNLLNFTSQMIMVCRLKQNINVLSRIAIAIPENAEFEQGFEQWVTKILNLAKLTGKKIVLYSTAESAHAFDEIRKKLKSSVDLQSIVSSYWYKFLTLSKEVKTDDLFVVVSARGGSVSHRYDLDEIPGKIGRYFPNHNVIIIYPEQLTLSASDRMIVS